jgi:hypothetical protein
MFHVKAFTSRQNNSSNLCRESTMMILQTLSRHRWRGGHHTEEAVLICSGFPSWPNETESESDKTSPMCPCLAASLSYHYDDQCCASSTFVYINALDDPSLSSQTFDKYAEEPNTSVTSSKNLRSVLSRDLLPATTLFSPVSSHPTSATQPKVHLHSKTQISLELLSFPSIGNGSHQNWNPARGCLHPHQRWFEII